MAGRQRPQEASSQDEIEDMEVEDLEELVRQHDQQQPSEEERREVRNLYAIIRCASKINNRQKRRGRKLGMYTLE